MMSTTKTHQASVTVFGIEHHRATVEARPGDRLLVRLPENPEDGYGWHANKTSGLQFIDQWYEETGMPGGGFRYWKILVTSPGKQFFRAVHWRREGPGNFPPIIFQVHFNVLMRCPVN